MDSEDARYLKRKIKSRSIDVHPTEKALVVNYELEALILGNLGDPLLGDSKECQKIIRLRSLNENTDCTALAKEVVEKCSLIHPSKLLEVEHLIRYLQKRKEASNGRAEKSPENGDGESSRSESPGHETKAFINNSDEYIELLYEDIPEKIKGSSLILSLARNPDNLLELSNNEALLSALSRVMREDWKKSYELSSNIAYTFFCFSAYTRFHGIILQYKIGSLCMEIIDYELRRYDQWKDDLDAGRRRCESAMNSSQLSERKKGSGDGSSETKRRSGEIGISHIPVPSSEGRRKTVEGIHSPGELWEAKRKQESLNSYLMNPSLPDAKEEAKRLQEEYEKSKQKFEAIVKKQEHLLRVCVYVLLNIAEDTKVEDKMRKKNIVGMLIKLLDRDNIDLLLLVVMFLKKLSIFVENKDDMADLNVIEKLPRILLLNHPELIQMTLRLMFNLSFDAKLREKMVRVGFLPKVVSLLEEKKHETVVLKILYHMSMDNRCKSMFPYTDCIQIVMKMLLEEGGDTNIELIALCVNLAINKRNAQLMLENNNLQKLMSRAFKNQDSLVMKLIRNIAEHDSTKNHFVEFVGDIAQAIIQCENEDFVVECVGVLGNLTLPDLDFSQLMQRYNLVPWVLSILSSRKLDDDLVLEVVILLGTAAADEGCASLLCKADVLNALIELLKAKQEDDEMVLQIIYMFYQTCRHAATKDYIIKETDAPAYLLDLMHDNNKQICRVANACLDVIADHNEEWRERIKEEKFRFHNSQWLEMIENASDPEIYPFESVQDCKNKQQSGEMIPNTMIFSPDDIPLFGSESEYTNSTETVTNRPGTNKPRPRSRYKLEFNHDQRPSSSYGSTR